MLKCVVIGAGPGGLVCTKELIENGVEEILCLERADRLGGTFADTYDDLLLTSSVLFSMFSDFWVGDGNSNHFWTKEEAVDYWRRYAEHFGVVAKIRFGADVTGVRSLGRDDQSPIGGWEIELRSGERIRCERLVLAVGNNRIPRSPDWRQRLELVDHSHSRDYQNADRFAGKRVLVVGGGESGSDVALGVSRVAARCWVSLRETTGWVVPRKRGEHAADISTHRGFWGLPRDYGEHLTASLIARERARRDPVFDAVADLNEKVAARRGIWGIYGTKTLALPQAIAHHGCEVVGEITEVSEGGKRLRSADGKLLTGVDAVVFCTGYENRIDFMPPALRERDPRSLYKHLFDTKLRDRLAWIGWARPGFGSQFPIMEMQARLFALVATGKHELPSSTEMERVAALDRAAYLEQFEHNAHRIRSLVDYHRYMDDLAETIGCEPPLAEYMLSHPTLWLRMVYGPTQATQFRLRGPGQKVELAHRILEQLPVATLNPIVMAGLRGRIRYGLRTLGDGLRSARRSRRDPTRRR
jgi:dimethylaniline monooxygenase (N-oxide forming)